MQYYSSFFFCFLFLLCQSANGQTDSISTQNIPEVEVAALKINTTRLKSTLALSSVRVTTIQDTRQQLSLQEYLTEVPGLFTLNANNYAQDLRISIRGFGARAAFGIRGVKLIVDGIPETTPDGQGQVDNLNLSSIEQIEVIKGAASVLYGNASGGVINIQSPKTLDYNFLEAGLTFGGFTYGALPDSLKPAARNMQQYQLKGGFQQGQTTVFFQGNYVQSDGYRLQSGLRSTNLNTRVIHRFSSKSTLSVQANYTNSPQADDPGGLNQDAVDANRSQARDRNVLFQTGESINQFKVGLHFTQQLNNNQEWQTYGFYSNRDFSGALPFESGGMIELNRHYFGHGSSFSMKQLFDNSVNEIRFGYELAAQSDDRQRFNNLEGIQGEQSLSQVESFSNFAFYALDHFSFQQFLLSLGIRYDWNRLAADDRFLSNGDGSGSIQLSSFNPSIGLSYSINDYLSLYTNYRSGFETPSLSELSANPRDEIGFNTELKAQNSHNIEFGWRGDLSKKFNFDVTYFYIRTQNELVPYELAAFPDRTFFRNAGTTNRNGIEAAVTYYIFPQWFVTSTYTYADFVYKDFDSADGDFSGNQLPGIPKHFATFSLNHLSNNGFNFRIQARYNGSLFTVDSNEASDGAYTLVNTSIGYRFHLKNSVLTPFFGINNLLNQQYNDNIRINAFGNRFFEPGPELNFYGGVRWRWNEH